MAENKISYISPEEGVLEIAIIRDANPRVTIALDLGIPNFTVFSLNFPLAEGAPTAMAELIAEAVNVVLDEVASFMMAQEYEEPTIVQMYQTVLTAFKSMSTEADTSKEQDVAGQDPTVQVYEGTFKIPMEFINATQKHVVTGAAKVLKRQPKVRHIELTYSPKRKTKPDDSARVIRQYRNRSLKQQPKPMFVIVYDSMGRATGTIPIGTGKTFKNQLLKMLKKGSVDFTAPVSFTNESEMKSSPLNGIPRAVSVAGITYQPEGVAGPDMALYKGQQDWLVKFPDGRSQIFPGRPTFRKMRLLNFPVPKSRVNWTMISQDQLGEQQDHSPENAAENGETDGNGGEHNPGDAGYPETKEAAPEADTRTIVQKDTVTADQIMEDGGGVIYLKPVNTYDDIVGMAQLKKRLAADNLTGRQIFEGLMLVNQVGHHGVYEGESVVVVPHIYIKRLGVKKDDGTWQVYHKRSDGKAQRVGFRQLTDKDFQQAKPVNPSI